MAPPIASDFDIGSGNLVPWRATSLTRIPRRSMVIPSYNEGGHIGPTLDRVRAFVRQAAQKVSLTGKYSGDRTPSVPASRPRPGPGNSGEQIASRMRTPLL